MFDRGSDLISIVVVQARTNSSRLPGKVLLPIGGVPLVVLVAKRAANTGRKVIVATSIEKSDDVLAQTVEKHGIHCFRGSLENTLSRFVDALSIHDDSTIVFRLTADNVIPDGILLDEIERDFIDKGVEYLCCNGINSGLPYGMSVEVTRLKHLREAFACNPVASDAEHVTPYVVRKFGAYYFDKYLGKQMGSYRCTIDNLDDYLSIAKIFEKVNNPISAVSFDIIEHLKGADFQPMVATPASKLVLGTAQLGLGYGIANTNGQPSREDGRKIIKAAIVNGVKCLDTARAYGNSEEVIGSVLNDGWKGRVDIVTKLLPLNACPVDADIATVNAFVDASVYRTASALGVQKIDTLLLHRSSDLHAWNGYAWKRLIEHRENGLIKALGISVQTPDELILALENAEVAHIQLPLNLLDWRWHKIGQKIQQTKDCRILKVHVRSVLLQGLLNSDDPTHWLRAHVDNPERIVRWMNDMCQKFGRTSIADLCVGFVMGIPWVDGVVVGVENMEQLSENITLAGNIPLKYGQIKFINDTRPKLEVRSLNPSLWKVS